MIATNMIPGVPVNINLLQVFLLVAEYLSFKEAADRVSRSQSAVSAQIKQLEEQLGVPLFYRTTRKVSLTPYGEILQRSAQQSLLELGNGIRQLTEFAQARKGHVSLACVATIAETKLPAILKLFEARHAGIHVTLTELPLVHMTEAIRNADVDFGLGPVFTGSDEIESEPIFGECLHALVPVGFGLRTHHRISIGELARFPVLMSNRSSVVRQIIESAASAAGVVLDIKYECTQHQTMIAMVAAGLGVAVLPQSVAEKVPSRSIRTLPIDQPALFRQVAILTRHGQKLSAPASDLIELIRREINMPDQEAAGYNKENRSGYSFKIPKLALKQGIMQ